MADPEGSVEERLNYLERRVTEMEDLKENLSMLGETLEHLMLVLGHLVQQHPELQEEGTLMNSYNRIGELVGELSALLR